MAFEGYGTSQTPDPDTVDLRSLATPRVSADVSMARLREMAKRPYPDFVELSPREEQTMSMAAELIRLRELIGHPCNFRVDLKPERVILEMPLDEFRRCRALLEEAPK